MDDVLLLLYTFHVLFGELFMCAGRHVVLEKERTYFTLTDRFMFFHGDRFGPFRIMAFGGDAMVWP